MSGGSARDDTIHSQLLTEIGRLLVEGELGLLHKARDEVFAAKLEGSPAQAEKNLEAAPVRPELSITHPQREPDTARFVTHPCVPARDLDPAALSRRLHRRNSPARPPA